MAIEARGPPAAQAECAPEPPGEIAADLLPPPPACGAPEAGAPARSVADILLSQAARDGDMEAVFDRLDEVGWGNIDQVDERGQTPIYIAVEAGQIEMVEMLVCHNADPTLVADDGSTPLSVAVRGGDEDILGSALLLLSSRSGEEARKFARKFCKAAMRIGADGTSPLVVAVRFEPNVRIYVKGFIEQGADVDQRDGASWTPLVAAVQCDNIYAVGAFITAQACVNRPNAGADPESGRTTPLLAAVRSEDLSLVRLLLYHGAVPQTWEEEEFVLDDAVRADIQRRAVGRR
ncbi:ankyrin repeat-containing domain protein [Pelagophyceae sp. CCMP2097]|nr:ankyrin repeat-containing domain protein [Pelagophyceae sp. CCMP2097]